MRSPRAQAPPVDDGWDVIVVGGGPAGLSAALLLGRCRRRVVVFDDGRPRNAASRRSHAFFTRDGARPSGLLRLGRAQLQPYGVQVHDEHVVRAKRGRSCFDVVTTSGRVYRGRILLVATGIADDLPPVEGVERFYGKSIFHCPFCDAWEHRDRRLAVYGTDSDVVDYALGISIWSNDVVLCTNGWTGLRKAQERALDAHGVRVRTDRIARLEGRRGALERIVFERGRPLARDAMFFHTGSRQKSDLAERLGCPIDEQGAIVSDPAAPARVPGLYVAGDASHDMNFIAIAVAEGMKAACSIHRALRQHDSKQRVASRRDQRKSRARRSTERGSR